MQGGQSQGMTDEAETVGEGTCQFGEKGHVTLERRDMSFWGEGTCQFGEKGHVSLERRDMSLWREGRTFWFFVYQRNLAETNDYLNICFKLVLSFPQSFK